MSNSSKNSFSRKKAELITALKKIENDFRNLKRKVSTNQITQEEFESYKVNLLEEIKKNRYIINQLKETLNVKNSEEKLILSELNLLSERFQTEIDEDTGIATIFLSASVNMHFNIDVDCSMYPNPPYIFIPQELNDLFEGNLVSKINSLQRWSIKKPPHLVEIFEELEEKLVETFIKEENLIERRKKMAYRRKIIYSAREAEQVEEYKKAINLYREVIAISNELQDQEACYKYTAKILEVEKNLQ